MRRDIQGNYSRDQDLFLVSLQIYETKNGLEIYSKDIENDNFFSLIDNITLEIRSGIGLTKSNIEESIDLPISSQLTGDMKEIFNNEFINQNSRPNIIITNPPRDGMHKKVIEQILNIDPIKIIYISCNSATQARDISLLEKRYKTKIMQAVDMFPQTYHVENIAVLEKK